VTGRARFRARYWQLTSAFTQSVSSVTPSVSTRLVASGGMPCASRRPMRAIRTERGAGERGLSMSDLTHKGPIGDVSDRATADAAAKFLTGLREVPEVRRWLRESEVPAPK